MKDNKKIGCLVIAGLLILSIVCIILSLDDKTGKSDPDKWYLFIPSGILLIILFYVLGKFQVIYSLILKPIIPV